MNDGERVLHAPVGEAVPIVVPIVLAIVGFGFAAGAGVLGAQRLPRSGGEAQPALTASAPQMPVAPPQAPVAAPQAPSPPPAPAPVAAPAPEPTPTDCPPLFAARFVRNSATPIVKAQAVAALAKWLVEHPRAALVIDGHADSKGALADNLFLSRIRAERTADVLVQAGVPRARITCRAFGPYVPLVGVAAGARENRRVVLAVVGAPPRCPAAPGEAEETSP